MYVVFLALGTRGDVQPLVAFGRGMAQAGHRVRFVTHEQFRALVEDAGLEFASIPGNPAEIIQSEKSRKKNPVAFLIQNARITYRFMNDFLADSWAACQGAEAIVHSVLAFSGFHVAEALGVPCYQTSQVVFTPTRDFPCPLFPLRRRLGGTYNRLTHVLVEQGFWQLQRIPINRWRRKTLNLPKLPLAGPYRRQREQKMPLFYCISPSFLPKPADWPESVHLTGYWFLDRPDWQPSAELADFLEAGPPPVYVGLGSTPIRDPAATTRLILDAIAQSGQRAILSSGWGGLGDVELPETVFKIEEAAFEWLFPRMAAVVHHGGAGTTAAGLRAGVPNVTVVLDAYLFEARRMAELGVAPPPLSGKELTAVNLAAAIRTAVGDEGMRARAAALGAKIQAEDGVARAVELFHHYLPNT